jgi:hypothetical protein
VKWVPRTKNGLGSVSEFETSGEATNYAVRRHVFEQDASVMASSNTKSVSGDPRTRAVIAERSKSKSARSSRHFSRHRQLLYFPF